VKRGFYAALALLLLAAGALGAYVLYERHLGRDIRGSSTVEFVTTQAARPRPKEPGVFWPMYGYDSERQRAPTAFKLRPPFRRIWAFTANDLLEFPPVIAYGRLFFTSNSGKVFALSSRYGRRAWIYRSRRCAAASPAVHDHVVFQTFLNRPPCNSGQSPNAIDGEVIALSTRHGTVKWRAAIGPSESSPVVANGLVYVGDWRGTVSALDERTGKPRWRFAAGGRVKDAPALTGRRLVFGSYDGHVYAVNALTGKLLWKAAAQPRLGGLGTFYSTPAVAYGRVYIGSTDGKVYSYGAASGKLRWSYSTGAYVYASPAVWRKRVLVGSYSQDFYALDAATGNRLWQFKANGAISGSATVIDGIVYFASLTGRTYALDARTGRQVWTFPDGRYTPVVADRDRLYLIGYHRIYGMVAP
jgi:outer membrane protein assembly factor BamB